MYEVQEWHVFRVRFYDDGGHPFGIRQWDTIRRTLDPEGFGSFDGEEWEAMMWADDVVECAIWQADGMGADAFRVDLLHYAYNDDYDEVMTGRTVVYDSREVPAGACVGGARLPEFD